MENCGADSKPHLSRFSAIYTKQEAGPGADVAEGFHATSDSKIYQPPHLNPVFYEEKNKKKSQERVKKRAARFILEDPDVLEAEDLPVEVHFGAHRGDAVYKRKLAEKQQYEEENFLRLQITKSEKQMRRRMERGDFSDFSFKDNYMQLLLQSSDEEMDYKAPLAKKKRKKLKRLRYKNKHKGKRKGR